MFPKHTCIRPCIDEFTERLLKGSIILDARKKSTERGACRDACRRLLNAATTARLELDGWTVMDDGIATAPLSTGFLKSNTLDWMLRQVDDCMKIADHLTAYQMKIIVEYIEELHAAFLREIHIVRDARPLV